MPMRADEIQIGQLFHWKPRSSGYFSGEARVAGVRTDRQEGLSPEADDYAALWIEALGVSGERAGQPFTVMLGDDTKTYLEGKEIIVQVAQPETKAVTGGT
jgi:hypothetical protein